MNKSALRNFAVWARVNLIDKISSRANLLGVYENKPVQQIQAETDNGFVVNGMTFNYKKQMRDDFIKRVKQVGYQDAIEEIAYTWFNRIVALRFMEINGYLKNGKNGEVIYIIGSTTAGKSEPDAVTYADKLSFVDKEIVYKYQDENKTNELYRYILTSQCNELNKVMPLMFEKIDNYVELLLPDHLLDNDAIISHLVNDISAKDFNITIKDDDGENASQVEIIGWLYQFYISEKKDEVFASKDKIDKGTLPAVTQLFTPDWIVRYMVENSLGKMWVDGHKSSNLKQLMKYYVEEAEQTEEVKKKLDEINKEYARKNVKEITFIDPCCGSGHILVYAFEIFFKMYQESGYIASEIPALILKNNLFGIDVDKRAAQLTSFALTMKALSYDKDFLKKQVYPNVIDIKESNLIDMQELKDFISLANLNIQDEELVLDLIEKFKDAELYGSLIKDFKYTPEQYDIVLKEVQNVDDNQFQISNILAVQNIKPILTNLLRQAIYLSSKYDIMATNPPYLSPSSNDKLKKFANTFYPDSKTDMFAMFMEIPLMKENGFLAMINMHSWMFLSSYSELRKKLLLTNFVSMCHLGARAFEDIGGEVVQTTTFVIRKTNLFNYQTKWFRLLEQNSQQEKENKFLGKNKNGQVYISTIQSFINIPGNTFAYWLSNKVISLFNNKVFDEYVLFRQGMATSDNNRFLRFWQEVDIRKLCFNATDLKSAQNSKAKWFPYNKGGTFRKWYGNAEYIVNWENDGAEMKEFTSHLPQGMNVRLKSREYYFKETFSWSKIAGTNISFRYYPYGFAFDVAGCCVFDVGKRLYYLLGLSNSVITRIVMSAISPTLNFELDHLKKLPIIESSERIIDVIVKDNINLSKNDWDLDETSWDFEKNPLLAVRENLRQIEINHQDALKKAMLTIKEILAKYKIQYVDDFSGKTFGEYLENEKEDILLYIKDQNKIYLKIEDPELLENITKEITKNLEKIYYFVKDLGSMSINSNFINTKELKIIIGYSLQEFYSQYKNEVNARFDQLKRNEEELNRIFIDIYGLQDELTPDVEDKDVTVARIYDKKEDIPESMKGNIYVRTKQDVVKDLLSYIVGCAFGRYSPYKEGLIFAGGDFNWEIYFNMLNNPDVSIIKNIKTVTNAFLPTDDNCIVNTDNDYVEFNLVDRVIEFVRLIFGQATLEENLRFIANALDEKSNDTPRNVIREYLANDFFKDHCKKYQNRPIYWQFDSGKNGGFRALMYLHRYDLNTIPTARLSYLHDIQWKYEHEKDRLEQFIEKSNITAEKAKAKKELDLINKQILECKAYDEILNHASNMNIQIDLDDGVKVNYQKFQKLDGDKDKNIFSTYLKF